jgi:long-chain acyl-CoA synthetase
VGSSGENIYPEEIESVINRFQHVLESVVVERKGKLIALVHFNIDELEGQFRHMKAEAIKHVEAKKEEAMKHVEAKKEELLLELREFVNSKVNSFSRIQLAIFQVDPFEKTATKKIKRYLYK